MHALALTLISLACPFDLPRLPADVREIQDRDFSMALRIEPDSRARVQGVRVFVSKDQGKTWVHHNDYSVTDDEVTYSAASDGLYWFALQVVGKDGQCEPADMAGLAAGQKVYVNAAQRALKPQKSTAELEMEMEDLRKTVTQLEKRIAELESNRKR